MCDDDYEGPYRKEYRRTCHNLESPGKLLWKRHLTEAGGMSRGQRECLSQKEDGRKS